jgi:hypothetical protein
MSLQAILEQTAVPLDEARRAVLRVAQKNPRLSWVLGRREHRLAVLMSVHAAIALVLTVFFPTLLLILGPVLLGVLHIAADVRHLVLRRALPAWWKTAVWVGCAALIGLRVFGELAAPHSLLIRLEWLLVTAWALLGVSAGAIGSRAAFRAVSAGLLVSAAGMGAVLYPRAAQLVFVHAHNAIAIVLWLYLFRRSARVMRIPLALIAGATLLLLSGVTLRWMVAAGQLEAFGLHFFVATDWLAPGLPTRFAVGLTSAYIFLQSVHYAIWLFAIPQEDTRGQGTPTFRMAARALLREFGGLGLALAGLCVFAVLAAAFTGVLRTRHVYLSLAMFHGYMELALLAYFFVRAGHGRAVSPR